MTGIHSLAPLSLLLIAACAGSSGFQQDAVRESLTFQEPAVNEVRVEQAFALRPQLPKPYRLGIYFREPQSLGGEPAWRWESRHKEVILGLSEQLEASGEVSEVFSIGQGTLAGDQLADIRVTAARHGADALLVVSGVDVADHYANLWAISYAVVLPLLFAPGNGLDVLFTMHAEMWDVRNEYLYLAAEAEAESHQMRAAPYIDEDAAVEESQTEAVDLLAAELAKRFSKLHAGTPEINRATGTASRGS